MSIIVKKAGILATIQDLGRFGFRSAGINPNGAMDRQAARLINVLLENDENEPVLEMHFPAPVIEFNKNAIIAVGGADFGAKLDNEPIDNWRPYFVQKGRQLGFTGKITGNRAYLAVNGGFAVERWLASASTNLRAEHGGFRGRCLQAGDEIDFALGVVPEAKTFRYLVSNKIFSHRDKNNNRIRVIAGTELNLLTGLSEEVLFDEEFSISANSDRMGFRLSGKPLGMFDAFELVSSAVDFGTIQLLPDGQMIILMADHQTTGGYPRIAHVISCDLSTLAQMGVHDKVSFELITVADAESLILRSQRDFNYLKYAVSQRTI